MVAGVKIDIELVIRCNSIVVHNDESDGESEHMAEQMEVYKAFWAHRANDPIAARNTIISSMCPEVIDTFFH